MVIQPLSTRLIKPNFFFDLSHRRSTTVSLETRNSSPDTLKVHSVVVDLAEPCLDCFVFQSTVNGVQMKIFDLVERALTIYQIVSGSNLEEELVVSSFSRSRSSYSEYSNFPRTLSQRENIRFDLVKLDLQSP